MNSKLLDIGAKWMSIGLLLLSLFVYWRGHQSPGGGFIAGLVASTAVLIMLISHGVKYCERLFPVAPESLLLLGLFISVASSWLGPIQGEAYFFGIWSHGLNDGFPLIGALGSPMLFDLGVFLVVLGFVSSTSIQWLRRLHK